MDSLHVRFSAVLCVLATLSFQNVNPVENWNVFSSEKGEFKWAKFCDWEGNNFDEIQDVPIADNCGKMCLADLKCTHFSWVDETCFLKEITTPVNETPFQEVDRCGFVVNRKTHSSSDVRTITPTTTSVATSTKTHTTSTMKSTPSSTKRRSRPTTKRRRIYSTPFVYPAPKPTTSLPEWKKALNAPYEHSRIKWTSLSENVPFIPHSGGNNVYNECGFPRFNVKPTEMRILQNCAKQQSLAAFRTAGILPDCAPEGSVIGTFYTPHLQDCVNSCLTRTGCTKFSWKKTGNGTCYLTNDFISNPAENPYQGIFYRTPDQIAEEPSCIGGSTIFKHLRHQAGGSLTFVPSTTEQTTSTRTVASSTTTTRPTMESTIQTKSQSPPSTKLKDSSSNTLVTMTTTEKPSAFKSFSPSAKFTTLLETSIKSPQIMWASKCEFTAKEECGKLCLAGPHCTHFLWIKGICFLNAESKIMPMMKTNHEEEPECGYVANRNEKSGQILITSKDAKEASTVATLAPTPPITTLTELELPPSTSKTIHKPKTTKEKNYQRSRHTTRITFG